MEAPPEDLRLAPTPRADDAHTQRYLDEVPGSISDRAAARWREYAEPARELLGLPAAALRSTIRAADPEALPAGVLVLCVRVLTRGGRLADAEMIVDHLCGAIGPQEARRYRYLGALRSRALREAPDGQGRYDGEDLFQGAVERVLKELHSNHSAVTFWDRFCHGRLLDEQREAAGREGEKLRLERAEAFLALPSDAETSGSILDREHEDSAVAGTTEASLEEVTLEILEEICAAAPEPERTVLELLWLSDEELSVNDVARRLGLKPDRIRNLRLDAGKRALDAIAVRGHPVVSAVVLANVWSQLPRRRGSRRARAAPS